MIIMLYKQSNGYVASYRVFKLRDKYKYDEVVFANVATLKELLKVLWNYTLLSQDDTDSVIKALAMSRYDTVYIRDLEHVFMLPKHAVQF